MRRTRLHISVLILAALPLTFDGCDGLAALLERLTGIAYGDYTLSDPRRINDCPATLRCGGGSCVRVEDNGSFEEPSLALEAPSGWYGDQSATTLISCEGQQSLEFRATTPEGRGASTSSDVYQVVDYSMVIPETWRPAVRRVRAHAEFNIGASEENRQFGIRIDAYEGMAGGFPTSGDPENFTSSGAQYARLESIVETMIFERGIEDWQPLDAELWLPEETDFFVVFLQAIENVTNETTRREFDSHRVDNVQIAIDAGNTAPVASPDQATTGRETPVVIRVLANDRDDTSFIDSSSVTVEQTAGGGSASVAQNGEVTFTPPLNFAGVTSFRYTVADVEGLVSNPAQVVVTVVESGYDLALTKTASAGHVDHSGQVTFIVTVTNEGPEAATGIRVVDRLPALNFTGTNTTTTQGSFNFNDDGTTETTTWNMGSLASGESATLRITGLAHLTLTNTAEITGGLDGDTDAGNNSGQFSVTVGG